MPKMSIDVEIDHWINGAARFRQQWAGKARDRAEPVVSKAFRISQSRVHVISGVLKASGSYEVTQDGGDIVAEIRYEAPYSIYEFGRGGEHDALTPAIVEVEDEFLEMMMQSAEESVSTWR